MYKKKIYKTKNKFVNIHKTIEPNKMQLVKKVR